MIYQAEREELDYELNAMYDRYDGWGDPEMSPCDPSWDEIDDNSRDWLIVSEYNDEQVVLERSEDTWSWFFDELPF